MVWQVMLAQKLIFKRAQAVRIRLFAPGQQLLVLALQALAPLCPQGMRAFLSLQAATTRHDAIR